MYYTDWNIQVLVHIRAVLYCDESQRRMGDFVNNVNWFLMYTFKLILLTVIESITYFILT
jgi:hypothetical protein